MKSFGNRCAASLLPLALLALSLSAACKGKPTPAANTLHPAPFTLEKFNAVNIGDDWEQVKYSLGDPFSYADVPPSTKQYRRYFYSKPKDEKQKYLACDVVVDKSGKVYDKTLLALWQE